MHFSHTVGAKYTSSCLFIKLTIQCNSLYALKIFLSSDPVRLMGEFQFNLQSLKEIKVSDSFLTLDVDSQKCQNIETYNDCKTRLYIKNMTQVCGCLPLSHIMSEEVCYMYVQLNS